MDRHHTPSSCPSPSRRSLGVAAALAFAVAAVAAAQAAAVALTGEEVCVGQGCAIVGRLTRIPPAAFNLFGAAVLAAAGSLALAARRAPGRAPALALLRLLLGGALAAEGVLFAYQWHVAQAWCLYCLFILAAVVTLNLLLGLRSALPGLAGFAASAAIFSLLAFIPARASLDAGTLAVRRGTDPGGGELVLLFSENCPHCRTAVAALRENERCTVRLNPVAELPASFWPELPREPAFDPRPNLAVARLLGLETIPILIAREPGGLRVLTGEAAILGYVEEHCGEPGPAPADPLLTPWGGGSLLAPDDQGCGLTVECE